ncbi:MAG: hypothetical protein ACLP9L_04770 [Thermoguttaceae bacterium]
MRLKPGQIVEATFLDHCEGGGIPMPCIVYGQVLSVNKLALTVGSWLCADPDYGHDPRDPNLKCFTILRSTVTSIRHLTAVDGRQAKRRPKAKK